jgi:hypothetical protein
MQNVFDRLQYNGVGELNANLKLQANNFQYEDKNFLIFTQQWVCTKLNS